MIRMTRVKLTEYRQTEAVALSPESRDVLAKLAPGVAISPTRGAKDCYDLTPDSRVGLVCLPDVVLEIQPKISMDRVLFMISYAVDSGAWKDSMASMGTADSLVEAMAMVFCRLAAKATHRGLLHGYLSVDEAMAGVRGKIRFQDQIQRRFGIVPPIEVRYDEFTEDIEENRILRAALGQLVSLPLRSVKSIRGLREVLWAFHAVSAVEYNKQTIPQIQYSRLNEHYRPAIELASWILKSFSLELKGGSSIGTSFLIDMNEVFEAFLHCALKDALHLSDIAFPRGDSRLRLDDDRRIKLKPDLSWWQSGRCIFVGDAKYKRLKVKGFVNADLYQMLAYTTASGLSTGLLLYAQGEREPVEHRVTRSGKRIIVDSVDIFGTPEMMLQEVGRVADMVRELAGDGIDVYATVNSGVTTLP